MVGTRTREVLAVERLGKKALPATTNQSTKFARVGAGARNSLAFTRVRARPLVRHWDQAVRNGVTVLQRLAAIPQYLYASGAGDVGRGDHKP